MFRIGQSMDIHRFKKGRDLILGGVKIPFEYGLDGHSDADVLTHAIIESIIGALGLGDIGKHFPDTSPLYKGISSLKLLEHTTKLLKEKGYDIMNIDALVVIELPKLAPYIDAMKTNIANVLNIDSSKINVKATRGEGLGFVGRMEGVQAFSVCLITKVV